MGPMLSLGGHRTHEAHGTQIWTGQSALVRFRFQFHSVSVPFQFGSVPVRMSPRSLRFRLVSGSNGSDSNGSGSTVPVPVRCFDQSKAKRSNANGSKACRRLVAAANPPQLASACFPGFPAVARRRLVASAAQPVQVTSDCQLSAAPLPQPASACVSRFPGVARRHVAPDVLVRSADLNLRNPMRI